MWRDRASDLVANRVRLALEVPRGSSSYRCLRRHRRTDTDRVLRSAQDALGHVGRVVDQDREALELTRSQRDGVLRRAGGLSREVAGAVDPVPPSIGTAVKAEAGLDPPEDESPGSQ